MLGSEAVSHYAGTASFYAEYRAGGQRCARNAGRTNIEWINQAAEEVGYPNDHFGLIVIASAFHWMDRPLVAARCRSMLTDDGLLAVLGNPTPLMQIRTGTTIGAAILAVQDRWFGDSYDVLNTDELDRPEVVLENCGFSNVTVSYVPHTQHWTVERFLGFLRSTSSRPDQRLGNDFAQFARKWRTQSALNCVTRRSAQFAGGDLKDAKDL